MNFEGFTRREFIKITGLATAGIVLGQSCATFEPNKDWSQVPAKDFDIKAFDGWYRWNRLYNGVNPNLKSPHSGGFSNRRWATFRDNITGGVTPGISYSVPWGEVMVASAPGEVRDIHELHTGRAGGMMVSIAHPDNSFGSINMPYSTYYAHLNEVFVEEGQKVKRGQAIGNVTQHNRYAKLILTEGATVGNTNVWLGPDKYGFNHSYMDYGNGPIEVDEKNNGNKELMNEKWRKQMTALNKLDRMRTGLKANFLDDYLNGKWHKKRGYGSCQWSPVEKFRYLEELYKAKPDLFPNLSKDQFESMKKEFYNNQPIVLTLPLVKGGMKKY